MRNLGLAARNLSRQKKRTFLLGGAIAFGVMVMTLMASLTMGLAETAETKFVNMLGGHIYLTGKEVLESGRSVSVINDTEAIAAMAAAVTATSGQEIAGVSYRSQASGQIIFGSRSTSVTLTGVVWKDEPLLAEHLEIVEGSIEATGQERAIILPRPVMDKLGIQIGESALVRLSTIAGQQNVGEFIVGAAMPNEGTFGLGSAYVSRDALNRIIGLDESAYQRVSIALRDTDRLDEVTERIRSELSLVGKMATETAATASSRRPSGPSGGPGGGMGPSGGMGGTKLVKEQDRWEGTRFSLSTVSDVMEPVLSLTTLLDNASLGVYAVLLTIIMVGLLNTFRMILMERTSEIGTMRAMGMHKSQVLSLFVMEAFILTLAGVMTGLAVETAAAGIAGVIPISTSSPLKIFLDGNTLAFPLNIGNLAVTLSLLVAVTAASAYIPARRAARLKPADALRSNT